MLAIIGGSGLSRIDSLALQRTEKVATPYADEAVSVSFHGAGAGEMAFLSRHGERGAIPPHRINYRANIWALHKLGVRRVIGVNVVGGIHQDMGPGTFMVPDQLIDYTHDRAGTFFEDDLEQVTHIDFTHPFDERLRQDLLDRFETANHQLEQRFQVLTAGTMGCTQGPRLETAAEVRRLRQDGCDIVGMTVMPEAALARELGMAYAVLALSVNWAAGLGGGEISMTAIARVIDTGMELVHAVFNEFSDS